MALEKPFATMTGILVVVWVGWITIATTPQERIARGCSPMRWTGSFIESLAALTAPTFVPKTKSMFADMDYGCQFSLWRMIYESDYNQAKAQSTAAESGAPGGPPAPPGNVAQPQPAGPGRVVPMQQPAAPQNGGQQTAHNTNQQPPAEQYAPRQTLESPPEQSQQKQWWQR